MCYSQVHVVFLLYGISHVYGYFLQRHQDDFLLQHSGLQNESLNYDILEIEQPVDHFNQNDNRTWKMRYLKLGQFWKPGGTIMFYFVGEKSATRYKSNEVAHERSLLAQIAIETGAAYFVLEHRYYGASQPFDKPTVENLAFLTSRQVLADAVFLLQTLKKSPEYTNSKVIVAGGSYAGNLATWMKVMYPDLVHAVIASSAPVLAKSDFYEYNEFITETFRTYGSQECVDNINKTFNDFQLLLQTSEGIEHLKEEQNICKYVNMTVPENQQMFFLSKIDNFAAATQMDPEIIMKDLCLNPRVTYRNLMYFKVWDSEMECYNYDFNKAVRDTMVDDLYYWRFQSCTEFGYFKATTSSKQMFGNSIPLDIYYKMCSLLFGEKFNEERVERGVQNTNKLYGGVTPHVQNVVFSNGDLDPWHKLGVLLDLSPDAPAVLIKGGHHCEDIGKPYSVDSDSLKEARKKIKGLVLKWVGKA